MAAPQTPQSDRDDLLEPGRVSRLSPAAARDAALRQAYEDSEQERFLSAWRREHPEAGRRPRRWLFGRRVA
jgi:hypothetical protein